MSKRDTGTGDVLEQMVLPSLERGGYECTKRTGVGRRPAGGKHIVDAITIKGNQKVLVTLSGNKSGALQNKRFLMRSFLCSKLLRTIKGHTLRHMLF